MEPVALLQKLDGGDVSNIVADVQTALNGSGCSALAHRVLARIANLTVKVNSGGVEPILSNNEETVQLTLYCAQAILSDTAAGAKINSNSRTISSIVNILIRFYRSNDVLSAVKMLNAFLPILEKMSFFFSNIDMKKIEQCFGHVYNLLSHIDDSQYEKDYRNEFYPLLLLDVMLRVCCLMESCDLKFVLCAMRNMTLKFEKLHLNNAQTICDFNSAVVEKFLEYSKMNHLKAVGQETKLNDAFGALVKMYWQLLMAAFKTANIANVHLTVTLMSKFVASSFADHSYYVKCFNVISRLVKIFHFPTCEPPKEEVFISEVEALSQILENEKKPLHFAFTWVLFIGGNTLVSMDQLTTAMDLKKFFSTAVLTSIYHFTQSLSKLLLSTSRSTCVGDNGEVCPYKGDATLAFRTVDKFVQLCIDSVSKKDKEEWSEVLPMVKDSCDNLALIMSKVSEGKCVMEQTLKSKLCIVYHRLGNLCYSTSNWNYGLIFLKWLTKYFYGGDAEISTTDTENLTIILPRLSVCYENLQLKKEAKLALVLCVIAHFKCGTPPTKFIQEKWALLQNEDGDNTTADKLLVTSQLKSICPQFKFCEQLVPQIMLWELSCYAVHRMKKTDFIVNAWVTLKTSKASALQLLEGSALACQASFYSNDLVDWYNALLSSPISTLLSQVRSQEKAVALCAMGAHYHVKFLIAAQNHFNENYSKVEEVKVYCQKPASVKKPQDVPDPADVCQVSGSFPNLNLYREKKLIDVLDTAVNYWNSSLEHGLSVQDYTVSPIVEASGDYLLHAAFLYSLWGHNSAAAKAFQVCCTFARKMSLDDLLLQALSGLMNNIEVNEECIVEAENLLERLKNHHKINYFQKVYSTSRAFQALRTGSLSEGAKALDKIISFTATPSTQWCYAYAKTLQASYQLLPSSKHVKSKTSGSDLVRDGLSVIMKNIQDRRLSHSPLTYAAVIDHTLSSSLWIGRYFLHRHMPREARCYLVPELIIALKLGLATRAAEFICELALVDLLTENVDEAVTKAYDLNCILDEKYTPSDKENDKDDDAFALDEAFSSTLVVPKHTDTNLGASPTLQIKEQFQIPIFKHSLSCKCYLCRNVSVQIIWLMYGRIQAKINALRFFVKDSHATYKQIFKSADVIIKRLCDNVPSQGASLQQHQLTYTLICSKLDFVDMLVMYQKDKDAQRENMHIFNLLNNLYTDENHLKEDAQEQLISIAEMMEEIQRKPKSPRILNKTPEANTSKRTSPSIFNDKTPEMKEFPVTPLGPGKKRLPLKLVENSNHLLVPKTDQQFYSPKVSSGFETLIGCDDDDTEVFIPITSKENIARAPRRLAKTSTNKLNFLDKAGIGTCRPDGQDKVGDEEDVTTNNVSKSVQPSKPKPEPFVTETSSMNRTYLIDEKHSKRPTSKTSSGKQKAPSSQRVTSKILPLDAKPPSRRATSKPLPVDEKPPSRRVTSKNLPVDEKPSSQRATFNAIPVSEKASSSRRVAPTNSKGLPTEAATVASDSISSSMETISSAKANTQNVTASARSVPARSNMKSVKTSLSLGVDENDSKHKKLCVTRTAKLSSDLSEISVQPNVRQTRQRKHP